MNITLKHLLSNALLPMGSTLYIYGGGWNTKDTGAAEEARTIGVHPTWRSFFESRDAQYSYRNDKDPQNSFYPHNGINTYHSLGLDCSGYLGWLVYQIMHTENGKEGFVVPSAVFARRLAERGFGTFSKDSTLLPGDIVSIAGHVYLCIGVCADGSVVIAHSTPSPSHLGMQGGGVQLSALQKNEPCALNSENQKSEAYLLADHYMKMYFPRWYDRYPVVCKNLASYTNFESPNAGKFSWSILPDPDGLQRMSAEEILMRIFSVPL